MSAQLVPPLSNSHADRLGWLDLSVVLHELHNLRAAVSGMDDRRLRWHLVTAIDALVLRVQRNLEADGVWSKLAALDPSSDSARTFQRAVYFAIYQLYGDLRSGKVASSAQVVQASQAISNIIVRGWQQPKVLRAAPLAAPPPRSLAFAYLHSALEDVKAASLNPAHDEAIHTGVQVGVAHLARSLPFPQWDELAVVEPSSAPPATYQGVVLRLLEALSHSLHSPMSLKALEGQFNDIVDKINDGRRHFVALRDGPPPTTQSSAQMPPPQLISDHRARMYGVAPADVAARWA